MQLCKSAQLDPIPWDVALNTKMMVATFLLPQETDRPLKELTAECKAVLQGLEMRYKNLVKINI